MDSVCILLADHSNPLYNQLPSRCRSQTASYCNFCPKIGCHDNVGTSLSTSGPHNPNGISIGLAVFAQMTTECQYTLQWDAPLPLKIAAFHGGSGRPSNTCAWFPGPTRVLNPKRQLDRCRRFCRAH